MSNFISELEISNGVKAPVGPDLSDELVESAIKVILYEFILKTGLLIKVYLTH